MIGSHLARLGADDRRLRFGTRTDDASIVRYVAGVDFSRDPVFGVFEPAGTLIGLAHLALDGGQRFAEIGLSVDPAHRNRGHGFALLKRAIEHAASAGYRTLFMHCLSENEIVKRLARKSGLVVVTAHGEADARIELSRGEHGGRLASDASGPARLIDSHFNRHATSPAEPLLARTDGELFGIPVSRVGGNA